MHRLFIYSGIMLVLFLVLSGAGCSAPAPGTADTPPEDLPTIETIRVGYIPVLASAPFFIAYEKGYFADQGLEVELTPFRSGPAMLTPLSTGQLDVGRGATAAALFNAFHQAFDMKIVAGGPVSRHMGQDLIPLLVRKDLMESGDVTGISDLAERKVAVNVAGGTADYLLSQLLATEGLTIDAVQLVILPIPEAPVAFENASIDAAPTAEPLASQLVEQQLATPLLNAEDLEGTFQLGGVFFGKRLLEPANREVAVRFLAAYLKAERELYQQPAITDETLVEIINQYTELPPPLIQQSPLPDPVDGQIETELLTSMQDYFIQHGYTEYTEPIAPETMIDTGYREEALEHLDAGS
jgi:NitT/TauT family transport system substrate-binding protein